LAVGLPSFTGQTDFAQPNPTSKASNMRESGILAFNILLVKIPLNFKLFLRVFGCKIKGKVLSAIGQENAIGDA